MELEWRETDRGLECAGYRITPDGSDVTRPWRLEIIRTVPHGRSQYEFDGVAHRSRDDAMSWAEWAEGDYIRRITATGHFVLSAVAFSSFVVLTQFIGSLVGLLLVAGTLYVALRSLGNGLGVLLNDAWGWTRPGGPRSSLLEWIVSAAVERARRRHAVPATPEPLRSVRVLTPPDL